MSILTGAIDPSVDFVGNMEDKPHNAKTRSVALKIHLFAGVAELMYEMHKSCPHPQPLSQAWERRFYVTGFPQNKKTTRQRGARAGGEGGVRARD
jgi:hypothetical protein